MIHRQPPREASPRAIEGSSALFSTARGRTPAPRISPSWLPLVAKIGGALLAAAVLAIIGATAGARSPAPLDAAAADSSASSAVPPIAPLAGSTSPPSAPADAPSASTADGGTEPSGGVLPDGRVILNVASEEELTRLPGIGPTRARAIIALRQRLARFRAVEDLLRVKGIGRKTLRRIKPNVVLDRPASGEVSASRS
jgi:competence protein ComEA